MAQVRPFKCVRPAANVVDKVAALPYDVYNRAEAKQVVEKNPISFLAIDRAETQFDDSHDMYADDVYEKAREIFEKQLAEGIYESDESLAYYVYALTMDGRTQTGIVACSSIDDYQNGVIKKHENTRAEKEADRIRHVDTLSAQTGPIFLAYRANQAVKAETEKAKQNAPLYDFVSPDGIRHRVFEIADPDSIGAIEEAFKHIDMFFSSVSAPFMMRNVTKSASLTRAAA